MGRFRHDRLLEARVGLELTQEEAACAIGVDVRTYRRYESGAVNDPRAGFSVRHGSRRRLIDRMAAELGIDPRLLFEEDEPEGSNQSAAIATSAAPAAPGPHRLPPVPRFVGRTEILTRLAAWCRSGEPGVVALVGVGGAGKTSLAERLVSLHRADATVWSFYEDPRTEAMLDAALARIGSTAAAGARADQLERALRERGGLLVLDGLEVAQADGRGARARGELEDSALRRLLRAAAAGLGRAQVLITTRFVPVDLAPWEGRGFEPIALGDLPGAEAEELLERFGVEHGRSIAERFGGHALSLAVAGSYVRAFLGGDAHRLIEIDLLGTSP